VTQIERPNTKYVNPARAELAAEMQLVENSARDIVAQAKGGEMGEHGATQALQRQLAKAHELGIRWKDAELAQAAADSAELRGLKDEGEGLVRRLADKQVDPIAAAHAMRGLVDKAFALGEVEEIVTTT